MRLAIMVPHPVWNCYVAVEQGWKAQAVMSTSLGTYLAIADRATEQTSKKALQGSLFCCSSSAPARQVTIRPLLMRDKAAI